MRKRLFGVALAFGLAGWAALQPLRFSEARPQPPMTLQPIAKALHPPIDEMSGIVRSRRYPDVYWVHNDSGDQARLFAISAEGKAIMPAFASEQYFADTPVPGKQPYPGVRLDLAVNFDWEDIAIDGETLYIADMGNNGNARRDLGVYVVSEPNPRMQEKSRILKWLPVAYPDQDAYPGRRWHFDCEAIFVYRHKLYFLSKHRAAGLGTPENGSNLYRLETAYTDRVNTLKKIDSYADLGGWVTGADLSPDGKTLAVLCHAPVSSVWLFQAKRGDQFLSGTARRLVFNGADQCEAVCFEDENTLLVTNEQRQLFRLSVRDFRPVPAP